MSIEYIDTANNNSTGVEVDRPVDLKTINHVQGDTFFLSFSFQNALNEPIDLTNYSIDMSIVDSDNIVEYSLVPADVSLGSTPQALESGEKDELNIKIDHTDMELDPGLYSFDIQFTEPNGDVQTYFKGKIQIEQDIT